jgi:hypothetical protein
VFTEVDVAVASTGTWVVTEDARPEPVIVHTPLVVGVQVVAPKPALFKETGRLIAVDPRDAVKFTDVDRA